MLCTFRYISYNVEISIVCSAFASLSNFALSEKTNYYYIIIIKSKVRKRQQYSSQVTQDVHILSKFKNLQTYKYNYAI
jgi:hypothetical protein